MKKQILLLFFIILLIGLSSCTKDTDNKEPCKDCDEKIAELDLTTLTLNQGYYYNGDTVTFSVPDEVDYDLYYTETSDNESLKKIDDLHYTAVYPGTYTLTIRNYDYPGVVIERDVKIYSTNVRLSTTTYDLPVGKSTVIDVISYNNLYETSLKDFTFISSDDEICGTNGNTITALKAGKCQIEVRSIYNSNVFGLVDLTVSDGTDFYIDPANTLGKLMVAEEMTFSLPNGAVPSDYTWTTSDEEIIKIVKYDTLLKVIGVNEGSTNISGYLTSNPKIKTTYKVTVEGVMKVDYVSRLLHTAYDEVGTEEVGENHQKYGVWYGNDGQPWCAMFVSWCWYHAGLSFDLMCKYQGCSNGMEWAVKKGIFKYKEVYTPKSGDIVFFLSNGASHTGIVAYCDGTYVYTIEGNASDKVGIWRMSKNFDKITGYACPNYPEYDNPEDWSWIATKQVNGNYLWTHKGPDVSTQ